MSMKIILRDNVIWAQTATAGAKLLTFPSSLYNTAIRTICWCGTFKTGEEAGLALIAHCNEKGLQPNHNPISTSFGALAGKKANFHYRRC